MTNSTGVDSVHPRIREAIHFKSSENMGEVEDTSVQSVITSPPYWNLKDYKHPDQIGFGESYERYHERMDKVWSECKRVLKANGTMWIVIDKIMQTEEVTHIPMHIVQHCRQLGFLLQDMIIWNKPTAIAGMSPDNLVNKYEHVLFFSRSDTFKLRVPQEAKRAPPDWTKDGSKLTDFWRFPVKAGSIRKTPAHEAPYPEELIQRITLLSTDERDTILDPYLGSGTTMKVALQLNRNCVGYEVNPDFSTVICQMLNGLEPPYVAMKISDFT